MFRQYSIRGKLLAVILITTGATVALTCIAFIFFQLRAFQHEEEQRLMTVAILLADTSSASVAIKYEKETQSYLAAITNQAAMLVAAVYRTDGKLFVQFRRPNADPPPAVSGRCGPPERVGNFLQLFTPVRAENERVGTLFMRSDLRPMFQRLNHYSLVAFLVFGAAMIAAYLIGRLLQEAISRPIVALTRTAEAVAQRQDYGVRAEKLSEGELGLLTDAFNQMLSVIHQNQAKLAATQAELEKANRGLEATVADRTAALRETIAQLETFSYSVTHDMRGPLRAMTSFAQLLINEHSARLDPEAREFLQRIADSARRLDRLIQDVLQYSRVARDEMKLEAVNLARLTTDIVQQYPDIAPFRERIEIDASCQGAVVLASPAALTQVISNLLTNALKFQPAGHVPLVRVSCEPRDSSVRVTVADNGIGVPRQHQGKIFGVFQRLHGSEYPGTGIGLSIVKKAVERMSGTVGVESENGHGSRFWFDLPKAG